PPAPLTTRPPWSQSPARRTDPCRPSSEVSWSGPEVRTRASEEGEQAALPHRFARSEGAWRRRKARGVRKFGPACKWSDWAPARRPRGGYTNSAPFPRGLSRLRTHAVDHPVRLTERRRDWVVSMSARPGVCSPLAQSYALTDLG